MCESFRGEERGKSAYAQTESDYPRECEEGEARGEADYAQQLRLSGPDTLSGPEKISNGQKRVRKSNENEKENRITTCGVYVVFDSCHFTKVR